MTEYQNREKSFLLSTTLCWISALVFFAGLIVVTLGISDIGIPITIIGGIFLLISYIWMKYSSHKLKIMTRGDW